MKNKKVLIISGLLVAAGVAIFLISKKKTPPTPPTNGGTTPTNSGTSKNDNFPLKVGSKGQRVKNLQNWLMANLYSLPNFGADGDFGQETLDAVKQALGKIEVTQADYNLKGMGNA